MCISVQLCGDVHRCRRSVYVSMSMWTGVWTESVGCVYVGICVYGCVRVCVWHWLLHLPLPLPHCNNNTIILTNEDSILSFWCQLKLLQLLCVCVCESVSVCVCESVSVYQRQMPQDTQLSRLVGANVSLQKMCHLFSQWLILYPCFLQVPRLCLTACERVWVCVCMFPDLLHSCPNFINNNLQMFFFPVKREKTRDRWSFFPQRFDFRQRLSSPKPLNGTQNMICWLPFKSPIGTPVGRPAFIVFRYGLDRIDCACGFPGLLKMQKGEEEKRWIDINGAIYFTSLKGISVREGYSPFTERLLF